MRVIAGLAKGRKLVSVRSGGTRPTTDRVKEALFSSLGPQVLDARVLDLYAGSGALGIEALSRGAEHVTFIERAAGAAAALRDNLSATSFSDRATVLVRPVEAVLGGPAPAPVDVVLADPPYALGVPAGALELLRDGGWLSGQAVVVLEMAGRLEHVEVPSGYRIRDIRRYGDSKLVYIDVVAGSSDAEAE